MIGNGTGKWTVLTRALGILFAGVLRIIKFLAIDSTSTLIGGAGVVVAGTWLAILGDWGVLGLGLALMISLVAFGVRIILAPSLWLFHRAEKRKTFRRMGFLFTDGFYLPGVIILWHYAVLYIFVALADHSSMIPSLIFSYGMAIRPWAYMAGQVYEDALRRLPRGHDLDPDFLLNETMSMPSLLWTRHPMGEAEWKGREFARSNMFAIASVQLAYVVLALMVVFFHRVAILVALNVFLGFWFAGWIIHAWVGILTDVRNIRSDAGAQN